MGLVAILYLICWTLTIIGIKLFCYGMKWLWDWGLWWIMIAVLILFL